MEPRGLSAGPGNHFDGNGCPGSRGAVGADAGRIFVVPRWRMAARVDDAVAGAARGDAEVSPPLRLSEDDAVMLAAMVAGDRTYLTHALRVGFERTGSFHMLVVSGFHLAIVAACIFWITRRLRVPRVPATIADHRCVVCLRAVHGVRHAGAALAVDGDALSAGSAGLSRAQRAEHDWICRAVPAGGEPAQPVRLKPADDAAGGDCDCRSGRAAAAGNDSSLCGGDARPALGGCGHQARTASGGVSHDDADGGGAAGARSESRDRVAGFSVERAVREFEWWSWWWFRAWWSWR